MALNKPKVLTTYIYIYIYMISYTITYKQLYRNITYFNKPFIVQDERPLLRAPGLWRPGMSVFGRLPDMEVL